MTFETDHLVQLMAHRRWHKSMRWFTGHTVPDLSDMAIAGVMLGLVWEENDDLHVVPKLLFDEGVGIWNQGDRAVVGKGSNLGEACCVALLELWG